MTIELTDEARYALLCEHIYRRNEQLDQSLKLLDILPGQANPLRLSLGNDSKYILQNSDNYIYSKPGGANGFAAMVNQVGDKYVVTIRGTDTALGAWTSIWAQMLAGNQPVPPSGDNLYNGKIDYGDAYTSRNLGQGTVDVTQWDATKELVSFVLNNLAGGVASKVVVTGQSLGGGLAGLASAYFGVPGFVYAPAPYAAELNIEAARSVWLDEKNSFLNSYGSYFTSEFLNLSIDEKVRILVHATVEGYPESIVIYLKNPNDLKIGQVVSAFSAAMQPTLKIYQDNLKGLTVQRVGGELLTATDTTLGKLLSTVSSQLKPADRTYDIGAAHDEGKHSPALHALLALTDSSPTRKFENLLRGDQILRYSIVGEPASSDPKMNAVSAVADHGRIGLDKDPATKLPAGFTSYLMEDLLSKAYLSGGDSNLYNYFFDLFGEIASKGAAGSGIGKDSRPKTSLHDGVVKLALQVLRDAEQGTNSLDQVRERLGGTWNFAGGSNDGAPSSDKVVLNVDKISSTQPDRLEKNGENQQPFGVRDVNAFVAEALSSALKASGWSSTDAGLVALFGGTTSDILGGSKSASLDWRRLVVQAGGDQALSHDVKTMEAQADIGVSHAIIGGKGNDDLKGSNAADLIVGGDGQNKFEGGGGRDLIVGGSNQDTYTARPGNTAESSVVFVGGSGVDTASFGDDFSRSDDFTLSGLKLANINPSYGVTVTIGKDGRADSLIGVEDVFLSANKHHLKIEDSARNQTNKIKFHGDGLPAADPGKRSDAQPAPGRDVLDFGDMSAGVALTAAGDDVRFDNITFSGFEEIRLTSKNDTVSTSAAGLLLDLGDGDDTVKATGKGTIIKTGAGADRIELSHNGQTLIEDADASDRITLYGQTLTGAVRWGGSESVYAYDTYLDRYFHSKTGDLVILDRQGNETFVPRFNFDLGASNLVAGLYVIEVTFKTIRSNMWTYAFETAASMIQATEKVGQALFGWPRTHRKDPLVLDLDGNGISFTIQEASNAKFDIDKDGFAEPVGWIGGNDGFLVRDRNGNGVIDDVGEMFGSDTESGFAQLGSLDGNQDGKVDALDNGLVDFNGDGSIDSKDTFDSLKVWVDANEDGITDAGELKSLADYNIVAISTGATPSTYTDGADTISQTGTFIRSDGTTGLAADVQLETDNYNTRWLGDSTVSDAAASRPDLKGFGTLADLHVAMTLKPSLINVVDTALPTMAMVSLSALRDAVRPILYAWQAAVPVPTGTPGTEATSDFHFIGTTNEKGAIVYDFIVSKSDDKGTFYAYASGQAVRDANGTPIERPTLQQVLNSAPQQGSWQTLAAADVSFLERFTGEKIGFGIPNNPSADAILRVSNAVTAGWNEINKLAIRIAMQGELKPFFAGIAYDVATDTFKPTTDQQFAPMLQQIFQHTPADSTAAGSYLEHWKDIIGMMLPDFQRDDQGRQITDAYLFANIVNAFENVPVNLSLQAVADKLFYIPASELVIGNGNLTGGDGTDDIFYLNASDQVVQGKGGHDAYVVGYNFGHDVIQDVWQGLGGNQEDAIWFARLNVSDLTFARSGNDLLISQNNTDNQIKVVDEFLGRRPGFVTAFQDFDTSVEVIKFADGTTWDKSDIAKAVGQNLQPIDGNLIGTGDADYLYAGRGTTYMSGGNLGDQYFYGRGDGRVTIQDHEGWIWGENLDFVNFRDGIDQSMVSFQRNGDSNDLQIVINGTNDVLTIKNQFEVDYGLINTMIDRIEFFTFADGSYVGWEDIIKQFDATAGTDGNDTIYGFSYDDTLAGGKGDDYLAGGMSGDTYVYTRGDGNDTIFEDVDVQSGGNDTLVLHGIAPGEVILTRNGNEAILAFAESTPGAGDAGSVRLQRELDDWFGQGVEQIKFDDGTIWSRSDLRVRLLAQATTDGNDVINGYNTNDVLYGGKGDDVLAGGAGDDTYIYNRGDGNDTITEVVFGNYTTIDTLRLKGIDPASVSFSRNGNDLTLIINESAIGANDGGSILLKDELGDWFSQGVEYIVFDDGTTWDQNYLRSTALARAYTPGDDVIVGFNTSDILIGGRGNDTLDGGPGDDTYIYTRGDGNDTITDGPAGNFSTFDTLRLHGLAPSDVTLVRTAENDVKLVFAESSPGAGDAGSILLKGSLNDFFSQGVDQIVFDDGTVWSQATLRTALLAQATLSNDPTIVGFNVADTIVAGVGDRFMRGMQGYDTYVYTSAGGNDVIDDDSGTLVMQDIASTGVTLSRSGSSNAVVLTVTGTGKTVTLSNEFVGEFDGLAVKFSDGVSWSKGQIQQMLLDQGSAASGGSIYGYYGRADTIVAGGGDKYLNGLNGNDTYIYGSAGGNDVIDDDSGTLVMQDIASTGVTLSRSGSSNTLNLRVAATGKTVTLANEFVGEFSGIAVKFSDGVTWSQSQLQQLLLDQGSAAIGGSVYGYYGRADTIVAGGGDKYLNGLTGDDTYVYTSAGGNDTVEDYGGVNSLIMQDIASSAVALSRNGSDLVIGNTLTGKIVTVKGQFTAGTVSKINFSDGVSWNQQQILDKLASIPVEDATTYLFNPGGGAVTLANSVTTIRMGGNIVPADLYFQAENGDLKIKFRSSSDVITVVNDLVRQPWGVSSALLRIKFGDGAELALGQPAAGQGAPLAFTWFGSAANYTITGSSFGSNIYEVSAAGKVNFVDVSAAGCINVVKFDKGAQLVNVQANNFIGRLELGAQIQAKDVYWQTNSYGDLILKLRGDDADSINVWGDMHLTTGIVSSAIQAVKFADGTLLDMSHGAQTFTWLGSTANYTLNGTNLGTNVYEVTAGGMINFGDSAAAGGINVVKFDKGAQLVNVQANNYVGRLELGSLIKVNDVYWQTNGYGDLILKLRGDDADSINVWGDMHLTTGIVSSAIQTVKFADGTVLDMSHGAQTFTWLGTTANYTLNGTNLGTNVYEVTAGGKINFGDSAAAGGINVVKFDKGAQLVNVQANNFIGRLELGAQIQAKDVYWQTNSYGDLILKLRGDDVDSINVWGDMHLTTGIVSSAIQAVKFADGTLLDMSHGAQTFTWLGATANYTLNGTNLGTNVYEVTAGGKINFGDSAAAGGINVVKFDKGAQLVNVQANNFIGRLELGAQIQAKDVYWQTNSYGDLILKLRGDDADSINVWGDMHLTTGIVSSAIQAVKFADGTLLDMTHGAQTFTWLGTTANYTLNGTNLGTNVYEVTAGGKINFGDSAAAGGINIVKFDKGAQLVNVQANNFAGSLVLGPQISAQDVYWQTNAYGDLILKLRGDDTDSINVWGDLQSTNGIITSAIKTVKLADGSTIEMSHGPTSFTWIGTAGASVAGTGYGANIFEMGAGSETFTGGDKSKGGSGNNTYIAFTGTGQAVINPNEAPGSFNELDFVGGITDENLWFIQSGNNLKIDLLGTNTSVTINGWFSSSSNQLQEITAGGLKIDSQISQLVQAMASYSASHAGFDPTSASVQAAPNDAGLQTAIAAAWHA
ncbi:calcium-binding protein [Bradyrhizobium sp. HKCCYLS2038]|uniref:calcium-binding protein n=1 Tax=unclassified Bradyrhizobium TaxID=2631580 RepID=UPI003EBD1182